MKTVKQTIVVTGGGSGGHITPLLSVVREYKQKYPNSRIVYIGQRGDKIANTLIGAKDVDAQYRILAGKYRRYHGRGLLAHMKDVKTIALNFRDVFYVAIGTIQAIWLMGRLKPQALFVKGGFVVVPVGIAARLWHVPFITHDSDAVPGLANRIIGRWAEIHATGMPAEFYNYPKNKTIFTGVPIATDFKEYSEKQRKEIRKQLKIDQDAFVLLVTGGGLGAINLNKKVVSIAPELLDNHPNVFIMHIAGAKHEQQLKADYGATLQKMAQRKRVRVIGFTKELAQLGAVADIVVTRAGATAIAEFSALGKTCIVVPAAFLTGGHQLKNAQELSRIKAVATAMDDTTAEEFLGLLEDLIKHPKKRQELQSKIASIAVPDSSLKIVALIDSVTARQGPKG